MMRKIRCIVGFGVLLFAPVTVFAVAGWTDYSAVAELTPTIHHRYLVKLQISENPSGCKNKDTFYQDYDATSSEHMFDVVLRAVTTGKKMRVYVTGKCEINGYAEISSVSIVL